MNTREEWLTRAKDLIIEQVFKPHGEEFHFAPLIKISCGICPGKAIGIAVYPNQADDGCIHIFISPELGNQDVPQILSTVVHELVHAACMSMGYECKHGHPFSKMIRTVGLEGPAKATFASEGTELYATLQGIAATLGDYPHAPLRKKETKKRISRILTWVSETDEEYTLKISFDLTEGKGAPKDYNGAPMVVKDKDKLAILQDMTVEEIEEQEAEDAEANQGGS